MVPWKMARAHVSVEGQGGPERMVSCPDGQSRGNEGAWTWLEVGQGSLTAWNSCALMELTIDGRSQMDWAGWALDVGLGWADGSGGWALNARLDGDGMGTGLSWMGLNADSMVMG